MALTPPMITAAIAAAGPELKGIVWVRLTVVLGIAVATWAQVPANLAMQGVTTGAAGSGVVTGKMAVTPAPLPVPAAVSAATVVGLDAASVARAVGLGVAAAFNASATYQGVSVGVGSGTDVSKVSLSNGPSLVAAIQAAALSTAFGGVVMPRVATGLGTGIAALLLTGTGIGVVAGPVGPAPGAGTSVSRVF